MTRNTEGTALVIAPVLRAKERLRPLPLIFVRRWIQLAIVCAAIIGLLEFLRIPAAFLIGPMIGGILFALRGAGLSVPLRSAQIAQTLVGCLIAQSAPISILGDIARNWPLIAVTVVVVIGTSMLLGWIILRLGALPAATALWGSVPGSAPATIVLAGESGADERLVALMQYLRVAGVALTASLIAHASAGSSPSAATAAWFPSIDWFALGETLAAGLVGTLAAIRLRVPSATILGPMIICMALAAFGVIEIVLPPWLLAFAYVTIGLSIGLRFTPGLVRIALRAFPVILASTFVLIGTCALYSLVLVSVAGLDPMTAYLATSPGGADSIAIIAAASAVDLPVVMSMQMSRLLTVILLGPFMIRTLMRLPGKPSA